MNPALEAALEIFLSDTAQTSPHQSSHHPIQRHPGLHSTSEPANTNRVCQVASGRPPRQRPPTVTVPSSALSKPRSSQLAPTAPLLLRSATSDHCRLRNRTPDPRSPSRSPSPQTGLRDSFADLRELEAFHILPSGAWSRFARRRLTYSTTAAVHPSSLPA
jgi:hypothetical protein